MTIFNRYLVTGLINSMFLKEIETALWNYGIFRSGMVWNELEMISGRITK